MKNKRVRLLIAMAITAVLFVSGNALPVFAQASETDNAEKTAYEGTAKIVAATQVPSNAAANGSVSKTKNTVTRKEVAEQSLNQVPQTIPQGTNYIQSLAINQTQTEVDGETDGGAVPLSSEGNLTLVDDIATQESRDKQFITVMTRTGQTFYIIIDRASDKDIVYFLNLVDNTDLMALVEDKTLEGTVDSKGGAVDSKTVPTVLVTEKPDDANTKAVNTAEAESAETKTTEIKTSKKETEQVSSKYPMIAIIALLIAAGGLIWYFRYHKKKGNQKGRQLPEEYLFDEDESSETDEDRDFAKGSGTQEDDGI